MKVLNAYSKFLDVLTKILRAILIILLASMVIIMIYNVICRYIFSDAKPWAEELTLYISIFSIMLGLGIASRSDPAVQAQNALPDGGHLVCRDHRDHGDFCLLLRQSDGQPRHGSFRNTAHHHEGYLYGVPHRFRHSDTVLY